MSFILDAIAKSEQERQQQEAPDMRTLALPAVGVKQPRRLLPFLLLGALIINAIILAALQTDWFTRSNQEVITDTTPALFDKTAGIDLVTLEKPTASDFESASDGQYETIESDEVKVNESEIQADTVSAMANPDLPSDTESGLVDGVTTDSTRIEPDMQETINGTGLIANEKDENLVDMGVDSRVVSQIRDLPADIRKDVPQVSFSGHLYSSNPLSRYIFIDGGRPLTEGQQITDELYLHEITPLGVIVEFRGYLIEVGVLQNWTLN